MKRLRHCWKLLVFVFCVLFVSTLIMFRTTGRWDKTSVYAKDFRLPIGEQYLCVDRKDKHCLDHRQLTELIRLIKSRLATGSRSQHHINVASSTADDEERRFESPEGVISDLLRLQYKLTMKSNSSQTIFQRGYDTGVTKQCLSRDYGDLSSYPKSSVIIPFCNNELLVDVLHTVHSIVQRSPDVLLKEVILVDDNTTKADFKELLTNYVGAVFGGKVRILRSNKTLGLIQARLLGSRAARGDVIITMDAHMEVQETWLQALLYEIKQNRKTLATAMLDWMKPVKNDVWSYQQGINSFMCVFTWDLGFGFAYPRPEVRKWMHEHPLEGFPAPCSVGTIWAIDRKFFMEIGELDGGMQRWGGENLDLAIRAWLFGGRAIQVPCSHAAHVERPHQRDYRYGWDRYIKQNYKRVTEVWFGEYKKYVYRMKPELKDVDVGDISERIEVRNRAVHDFGWFLSNVYPELGLYDNASFGYDWLRNIGMDKCLHKVGDRFLMWKCLGEAHKEGVWLTNDGYMRTDLQYWQVQGKNRTEYKVGPEGATGLYQADWMTKWVHWKGGPMMVYRKGKGVSENLCMEAQHKRGHDPVLGLATCDPGNRYQRWEWRHYTEDYWEFVTGKAKNKFNTDYHATVREVMFGGNWEVESTEKEQ